MSTGQYSGCAHLADRCFAVGEQSSNGANDAQLTLDHVLAVNRFTLSQKSSIEAFSDREGMRYLYRLN